MDITKTNFAEWSDKIYKAIDGATFIAIDTELTGLSLPGYTIHAFETPEERYKRTRQAVIRYLVIQYGVAVFTHNAETNRYDVKIFNFYVFPRPFARQAPDVRFTSQCSSLDFLTSQGFDFNKTIRDGLSYLLPDHEDHLRSLLHEKHAKQDAHTLRIPPSEGGTHFSSPAFTSPQTEGVPNNKGPCVIPEDHLPFIKDICKQVEEFLSSERDELHLAPCNGYLRKLTFQALAQRFSGIHLESRTDNKRLRYILVTKAASPEEMRRREEAKRKAEFAEVDDAVGFSAVIKRISQSGKLVVGHNMLLDILHTIDKFCHSLPEDYEEFKHLATNLFPRVLDTKHMATSMPFKENIFNTTLGDMYTALQQFPFSMPNTDCADPSLTYAGRNECPHEAGYDAYMTGLSYIAMVKYLDHNDKVVLHDTPMLMHYQNKLFLMRMFDSPYINLSGDDVKPARDHVFHVTFPCDWKASDISQLFSPFGGVHIGWVDETTAFVSLFRKENTEMVLKSLPNTEHYQIRRYHDFHRRRRSLETPKRSVMATDKRKQSPVSDIELPRKKQQRRSSRGSSPFNKIPTIPEEEESHDSRVMSHAQIAVVTPTITRKRRLPGETKEEGELDSTDGEGDTTQAQALVAATMQNSSSNQTSNTPSADIGEVIPRKKLRTASGTESTLFDVPDNW